MGGPGAITGAMVARLRELGAELSLDTDVEDIRKDPDGFCVRTNRGTYRAGVVLNTQGGAASGPVSASRSLRFCLLSRKLFLL